MKPTEYEQIATDIKSAMKTGDSVRRDCLRSLMSEIKNQTVNAGKELTEDVVVRCVQKAVKQHEDSIAQFKSANRTDLVEKETAELKVLKGYLPKMLSEDETKALIDNVWSHDVHGDISFVAHIQVASLYQAIATMD